MGGRFDVSRFQQGNLQLDTIHFALSQDTAGLNLDGTIRNYLRKNPNKFTARLSAYIHNSGIGSHIDFTDSQGRKGIDLGLRADFINNGLNLSLSPNNPIIAYRRFNVNDENFIFLGKNKDIKADMNLLADDGTALSIYSTPADSVNDITLSINNLNLGELSNVMPYLPKLEGMLSGDMHVMDDHQNGSLSVAAQFKAKSLVFEDAQLGNVGMEAFYMPQATASIMPTLMSAPTPWRCCNVKAPMTTKTDTSTALPICTIAHCASSTVSSLAQTLPCVAKLVANSTSRERPMLR